MVYYGGRVGCRQKVTRTWPIVVSPRSGSYRHQASNLEPGRARLHHWSSQPNRFPSRHWAEIRCPNPSLSPRWSPSGSRRWSRSRRWSPSRRRSPRPLARSLLSLNPRLSPSCLSPSCLCPSPCLSPSCRPSSRSGQIRSPDPSPGLIRRRHPATGFRHPQMCPRTARRTRPSSLSWSPDLGSQTRARDRQQHQFDGEGQRSPRTADRPHGQRRIAGSRRPAWRRRREQPGQACPGPPEPSAPARRGRGAYGRGRRGGSRWL